MLVRQKAAELRTRVDVGVLTLVDRVATAQGRDRGEYLRALVIDAQLRRYLDRVDAFQRRNGKEEGKGGNG
jgi:hypothetical protein